MPQAPSPFAGVKLSEQTPLAGSGLDQRLFTSASPRQAPKSRVAQHVPAQERGNPRTQVPGKLASQEVGQETSQSASPEQGQGFDLNATPFRKDTFLFTPQEFEALEDLKLELRRRFDLKATKNDLARCALQHLLEDYRRHGETSLVVRRLRSKRIR